MKNAFLPTVSFLAIGALVFRWTKASVTFVCKSCLTGAIMLARSLSTSIRDFKIQDATASRTRWLIKDWD